MVSPPSPLFTFFISPICTVLFLALAVASPSKASENVTLSIYYESLCPYCADFIVNHLVKLFDDKELISIVDLRMIPWGNAFVNSDGTFACQHGPNECTLNSIEACAIHIYPDAEQHFRFIYCVERLSLENKLNQWINCFQWSGLGEAPIDCYTSGYGNVIERKYADETAELNPPHRFVPWAVVNNEPLKEDFKNFISYICKAYRGTRVPEGCQSLHVADNSAQKKNLTNSMCYVQVT